MDPTGNRRVIHRYPAIRKHPLKVTVADRKHQIRYHRIVHRMILLVNCRRLNSLPSTNTGGAADGQSREHSAPSRQGEKVALES
jgi:hypothetical protein